MRTRRGPARCILRTAYTLAVSGVATPGGGQEFTALAAYTTSRSWPGSTLPLGVVAFNQQAAANLGQARAFIMDLRRLAALPLTSEWFPWLDQPGRGVQGHMPKRQQLRYAQDQRRHPEIVERLGPRWPGGRR